MGETHPADPGQSGHQTGLWDRRLLCAEGGLFQPQILSSAEPSRPREAEYKPRAAAIAGYVCPCAGSSRQRGHGGGPLTSSFAQGEACWVLRSKEAVEPDKY